MVLIDTTSGNMGISMAFMAAFKGYKMVLTMPSHTNLERSVTMLSFGVDLILTDPTRYLIDSHKFKFNKPYLSRFNIS